MDFKIGDKLESLEFDKSLYDIDFVTITSINEEHKVYYWEATMPNYYGIIHSGYFFHQAKEYKD